MTAITSGNEYFTNSGLLLKFGTTKAVPTNWSEYVMPGPNRIVEGFIDLTTFGTTTTILGDVEFFPAAATNQVLIEKVELWCVQAPVGGTSFSLGLISEKDRSTIPSGYGTAFIAAEVTATYTAPGMQVTYFSNTAKAGSLIGGTPSNTNGPYLITGLTVGTYTAGQFLARIYYHGYGTITQ